MIDAILRTNILDGQSKIVRNIDEAVNQIISLYHLSEVTFGEFIASIHLDQIAGFNLEEIQTIIARARKVIDGHDTVVIDSDDRLHLSAEIIQIIE